MAIPYEKIVADDLNFGYGNVPVTMPGGGTASGAKIGIHTFFNSKAFNVLDFLAVGDGYTDDSTKIQDAIDATPAGGMLMLPFGYNFLCRSTLTLSRPIYIICGVGTLTLGGNPGMLFNAGAAGAQMIGIGRGATVIQTTHTSAPVFRVNARGVHFRDFDIYANPASTRAGTLIEPNELQGHVERVRIRGTNAFNCGRIFNHIGPSPLGGEWTYRDIEVTSGLWTDGWRTFAPTGTMAGVIIDNPIAYVGVTFSHAFMNFDGGTDTAIVRAAQCGAACAYTVRCQNTTSGPSNIDPRWIHLIDCRLEAGDETGSGVVVQLDAVRDFRYVGGYMAGGKNAVVLNAGNHVDISHNMIVAIGQHGIVVNADQVTLAICNNDFGDIGSTANNTYDYINIAANLQGMRINENGFQQVIANKCRYGINIKAGTGNFFTVNGNDFSKAGIGTAYLFNGATGSTYCVFGNLGLRNDVKNGAFGTSKFATAVEADAFWVSGNQVVAARGAAVADASGGATVDAQARTAINALLLRLRNHGLIDP